jgi:hypothetical protein
MAGGGGRGGSVPATSSTRLGQQAACIGPTGSRGGHGWLGAPENGRGGEFTGSGADGVADSGGGTMRARCAA